MWIRRKKEPAERFLVVCLGNPGKQYEGSRHNVGFQVADILADRWGVSVRKLKFKALYAEARLGDKTGILLKPQTYMNLSGQSVQAAASYYQIPPQCIVAVSDDVSLPPGRIRVRRSGSSGGQKGLGSIIQILGTQEFPRVKIGVGQPPHPDYEMANWVLGSPVGKEKLAVEDGIARGADAVEVLLRNGVEQAMNQFNAG